MYILEECTEQRWRMIWWHKTKENDQFCIHIQSKSVQGWITDDSTFQMSNFPTIIWKERRIHDSSMMTETSIDFHRHISGILFYYCLRLIRSIWMPNAHKIPRAIRGIVGQYCDKWTLRSYEATWILDILQHTDKSVHILGWANSQLRWIH